MGTWKNKIVLKGDKILWYVIIMLMILSVMLVYSTTGRLAYAEKEGNTMYYLLKQLFLIGGCFGVMFLVQSVHYKYFYKFSGTLLLISAGLLLWAALGSTTINETGRWIRIPLIGLTFQPSEIAKIAIMMYTAKILVDYQTEDYCEDIALKKFLIYVAPVIAIIFLDNFSTSVLIGVVCIILFMVGRMRWKLLGITIAAAIGMVVLIVLLGLYVPQVRELGRIGTIVSRITDFVGGNEEDDKEDYSYQAKQARIAIVRGGLLGIGPGNSNQRNFLPHSYSDFVYAIVIEEYGLWGGGFVMLLYLVILFRIGVIVRRCTRIYPALLAMGLGVMIVLQALINMGVCVGALPVTGQTLPLISMGGTSLWLTSASFGIILSISHTFSPEGEAEEKEREAEREARKEKRRGKYVPYGDEEDAYEEGMRPATVTADTEQPMQSRVSQTGGWEEEQVVEKSGRKRRRATEKVSGTEEEDIDIIEDTGLDSLDEELESNGRQILKELQKRGRRNAAGVY